MKQVVSSYSYSPTTNVVTLTGVNIEQDQLLLIVAPQVGRTMYNFASVTGSVVAGADTRVTLNASTVGLTTTSPLVIFYDDQASSQAVTGSVSLAGTPSVTFGQSTTTFGAVTGSVAVLNFPSSQTVTFGQASVTGSLSVLNFPASQAVSFGAVTGSVSVLNFPASQSVSFGAITGSVSVLGTPSVTGTVELGPNALAALESITVTMGSVTVTGGLTDAQLRASAVTISGTVTAFLDAVNLQNQGDTFVSSHEQQPPPSLGIQIGFTETADNNFLLVKDTQPLPVYGTVTVGNSVTIGSLPTLAPQLPRVTFIDGSGTVTTANSAITVFASSTTRSYLLVQVTTGSAFVNVGATATTVNGINLTAGQGYAWETTIPQGLVSLISTTTSSRWVAKEA